jgi:hypothetical protein
MVGSESKKRVTFYLKYPVLVYPGLHRPAGVEVLGWPVQPGILIESGQVKSGLNMDYVAIFNSINDFTVLYKIEHKRRWGDCRKAKYRLHSVHHMITTKY